jgi:hypothetical protein
VSGLIFPFATVLSLSDYVYVRQKDMDLRKADWQRQILGKLITSQALSPLSKCKNNMLGWGSED